MGRRRAAVPNRRTAIPGEYLQLLGLKIRHALQSEHVRHYSTAKRRAKFTTERVCVATGIPYDTMNAYLWGKRQPSILDLREICAFTGVSFEEMMNVIPSRKQLDDLWDAERARLTARAKAPPEEHEEEDDDP